MALDDLEPITVRDWPEPQLPPVISFPRPVQWKWDGLWEIETKSWGWLTATSARPIFNYEQKAICA